jgi:deazaflavin-dependent oxidoreductase (nitroreductase family)
MQTSHTAAVELYWIPLGAGGHSVRLNGQVFEAIAAASQHRRRCDLYHAALVVDLDGDRYTIELAPSPNADEPSRGVVATGAVGSRHAGRLRLFRYEVRCWRGGSIPDLGEAVGGPRQLSSDPAVARRLLDLAATVPTPVWGRDELNTGEMWNSNSVTAWLTATAGLPTDDLRPPPCGRAPGWHAGLEVARRSSAYVHLPERRPRRRLRAIPGAQSDHEDRPRQYRHAGDRRMNRWATRLHAWVYRRSGGRVLGRFGGQSVLLLQTTGRRSGRTRTTPLQYVAHGESFVVVAADHGARQPPAWYLNLCATAWGRVRVGRQTFAVAAREASGDERTELWRELIAANRYLPRVQTRAERQLPLLILTPTKSPPGSQTEPGVIAA